MLNTEITPEVASLYRMMSGDRADRYVQEMVAPMLLKSMRHEVSSTTEAISRLEHPYFGLVGYYAYYAFSRRGKDRHELSEIAVEALRRTTSAENIGQFLALDSARSLWNNFSAVCEERKQKPMEQLNLGVISGMAELAQEIYRLDGNGSIAKWVKDGALKNQRIEPHFFRMVDVRGMGPKLVSLYLRDIAHFMDIEEQIDPIDRLYVVPIDKWARLIAPHAILEDGVEDLADWVLAGKLAKYARRAGVSPIRFTMGVTHFGLRELRYPEQFNAQLSRLMGKVTLQ